MLENPVTDITIAMELNYFQLNRAEYFVPVHVKIPGSELALARRRGGAADAPGLHRRSQGQLRLTIQNVRDKLDIPISDRNATELATQPIQYETGFTLLPGQVRDQVPGPRRRGRAGSGHVSDLVHDSESESRGGPAADQHGGAEQPARAVRGGAPHGEELAQYQAQAANPLVFQGEKLVPSVTRVFSTTRISTSCSRPTSAVPPRRSRSSPLSPCIRAT